MKKSRFSDEQKVKMLREAEATSVAAVAKKHGISRETVYTWRRSFAGVDVKSVGPRGAQPCRKHSPKSMSWLHVSWSHG